MALIKKKRISKKNKSAWRKTDIKDVEDFLEDQRQDERIGPFDEKKDEELFMIDTTPMVPKPSVLSATQKRKLNAQKPLRSLAALENTSKVSDPIVKRNHVKQKAGRSVEQEVINPTKARHIQANKDRQHYYTKLDKKTKKINKYCSKDLWAEKDFRDDIPGLKDEKGWISKKLSVYLAQNMGKPVFKVHDAIHHRTTKAKNFEVPHPGMSYNPSLEDHQNLMNKVMEREEKIIKEEKHLKRVTTQMFSKVTPEEREEQMLKEMSSGLEDQQERFDENCVKKTKSGGKVKYESEDANNEKNLTNSDDNEVPNENFKLPVENNKKSKQKRRKELQQKELQKKTEEKKALKKQIVDINRIKSLKSEILAEEEALNKLKKHRKKMQLKKKFEPKRLGKLKFVEPDTDINMPEDIAGNLRNLKAESSLVIDRFKSFQRRNMLPVSVYTGKQKQKKVKRFVRNSHKEPGISFQMLREKRKVSNL